MDQLRSEVEEVEEQEEGDVTEEVLKIIATELPTLESKELESVGPRKS